MSLSLSDTILTKERDLSLDMLSRYPMMKQHVVFLNIASLDAVETLPSSKPSSSTMSDLTEVFLFQTVFSQCIVLVNQVIALSPDKSQKQRLEVLFKHFHQMINNYQSSHMETVKHLHAQGGSVVDNERDCESLCSVALCFYLFFQLSLNVWTRLSRTILSLCPWGCGWRRHLCNVQHAPHQSCVSPPPAPQLLFRKVSQLRLNMFTNMFIFLADWLFSSKHHFHTTLQDVNIESKSQQDGRLWVYGSFGSFHHVWSLQEVQCQSLLEASPLPMDSALLAWGISCNQQEKVQVSSSWDTIFVSFSSGLFETCWTTLGTTTLFRFGVCMYLVFQPRRSSWDNYILFGF